MEKRGGDKGGRRACVTTLRERQGKLETWSVAVNGDSSEGAREGEVTRLDALIAVRGVSELSFSTCQVLLSEREILGYR